MANKRMFNKDIVQSDAFLDMGVSAQALYFHLGMEADDDGFVGSPKKVMRVIGASQDDLKLLGAKSFILSFESGVIVIKHHRMNNSWDKHNCKRTVYLEEFNSLYLKQNRAYTKDISKGLPVQSDSRLETVFRREENRINIGSDKSQQQQEKNMFRKKAEDAHFENNEVDYESGETTDLNEQEKKERAANRSRTMRLNANVKLFGEIRGLPFGDAKEVAIQRKEYDRLLKIGWSNEVLLDKWEELVDSPYWLDKKAEGQYPSFFTLSRKLRNRNPI